MKQPFISILIVTWNRKSDLARCLDSALAQTWTNKEIVVVDNSSSDGTADMLSARFPQARLVHSDKNLGCPSGRNLGFRHCRGEYIYCLDDDGWLKPDAIEVAVRSAESDERIGVVMSRLHIVAEGAVVLKVPKGAESPVYQASFCGGCSLIRRAVIERAGGFPEDFVRQAEEDDLAIRILDAGYFCFLEPASVMFHAPSAVGRNERAFAFYTLRNTNRTGLRHWSFPWCALRPLLNLGHALRYMVTQRYAALPWMVLGHLVIDLVNLSGRRRPVSFRTNRLFLDLCRQPSASRPAGP